MRPCVWEGADHSVFQQCPAICPPGPPGPPGMPGFKVSGGHDVTQTPTHLHAPRGQHGPPWAEMGARGGSERGAGLPPCLGTLLCSPSPSPLLQLRELAWSGPNPFQARLCPWGLACFPQGFGIQGHWEDQAVTYHPPLPGTHWLQRGARRSRQGRREGAWMVPARVVSARVVAAGGALGGGD